MSPSSASARAKSGEFASSSLWKRRFSRRATCPGRSASTTRFASAPMQSSAKTTCRPPIARLSGAISGRREKAGSLFPFGRPKWDITMTFALLSISATIVGASRSIRVASVTTPSLKGTFRSARSNTRFPRTSMSSRVRNLGMDRQLLLARRWPAGMKNSTRSAKSTEIGRNLDQAVRESPFVVVPGEDADEAFVEDLRLRHIERCAVRVVIEVDRDRRRLVDAEDAAQLVRLRCFLHQRIDFLARSSAGSVEFEVDQRHIRGGHPDRSAIELSLERRQDETDRLRCTRRGRDHR